VTLTKTPQSAMRGSEEFAACPDAFVSLRAGPAAWVGCSPSVLAATVSCACEHPPPVTDFNARLHELRSRELGRLPPGAATVLHGGSAGQWYFDWFQERYTTTVTRHIGVDALSVRPELLAEEVEWLQRSLGDLSPVGGGEVDLVFAGQVIEHLWPEEVVGFLLEARRVLRRAGILVMDSPNRRVTAALGWEHPEHTVEFRPDEIIELLELAGFSEISVRAWRRG